MFTKEKPKTQQAVAYREPYFGPRPVVDHFGCEARDGMVIRVYSGRVQFIQPEVIDG